MGCPRRKTGSSIDKSAGECQRFAHQGALAERGLGPACCSPLTNFKVARNTRAADEAAEPAEWADCADSRLRSRPAPADRIARSQGSRATGFPVASWSSIPPSMGNTRTVSSRAALTARDSTSRSNPNGRAIRLRDHEVQVHAGSVQQLAMSGQCAVELRQVPGPPQCLLHAVGESQGDSRAPQQHHLAMVAGEVRERARGVDVRDADAPAKLIPGGRYAYGLMSDPAAVLPRRGREGGLTDDLKPGSLHSGILREWAVSKAMTGYPGSTFAASTPERRQRTAFLAELRGAAHEVGFFYVEGHGVDPALQSDLLESARRFFSLPRPRQAGRGNGELAPLPRLQPGRRRTHARPARLARADRTSALNVPLCPTPTLRPGRGCAGPNQWPEALPALRGAVTRWQEAAIEVLLRILRAFALALGQPADALQPLVADDPHYMVKLIRYPGRAAAGPPEQGGRGQGVGAHKDSELLTLLLQDEQGGLQVETSEGWGRCAAARGHLRGQYRRAAGTGLRRLSACHPAPRGHPASRRRADIGRAFPGCAARRHGAGSTLAAGARRAGLGPERDPENPLHREVE